MKPRERILMSLNHREPDKIPFDLNGSLCTGIHKGAYKNLLSYLGIKSGEINIHDPVQQLAWVNEEVLLRLKVDTRLLFPKPSSMWKLKVREKGADKFFTDEFGITWRMSNRGFYFDLFESPLENASVNDLEKYPWPDTLDSHRIKGFKEKSLSFHEEGYLVTVERIAGGFFEQGFRLRGFENFYSDLAGDPGYAEAQMDKSLELEMKYWDMVLTECGQNIDVILTANDVGGQNGPLISPAMFRKYIKPRMRKLHEFIKRKKEDIHIFFHSCGSIYELLPDIMETGVDIINPVQFTAGKMDSRKLKKEFGDVLTFWGGGVDTQRVLPYGTVQEVKDEVRKRIDDFSSGGGFVFAAVHNIQPDVPPENIMAMWETLQEYGKY